MESRKVFKIKNSFCICLPSSMVEMLEIKKGDRCQFLLLPGYGLLVKKEGMADSFHAQMEAISDLRQEADNIFHDFRRKARGLVHQFGFRLAEEYLSALLDNLKRPAQSFLAEEQKVPDLLLSGEEEKKKS